MVIWNSNGTSVLLFKTVSYQTHGVYKCIAQNEVGQARKMFRIFVEGMRTTLENYVALQYFILEHYLICLHISSTAPRLTHNSPITSKFMIYILIHKCVIYILPPDTRHTSWSTAFAVVIPVLVIISIAIFAFLLWKMQIQKNVVSHLTRVVFRETNNT